MTDWNSFPSHRIIINSTYPQGWVGVPLNMCRSDPLYDHKLLVSRPVFSNNLEYMISHELSSSISIWETSNFPIVVVITKGKSSLEFLQPYMSPATLILVYQRFSSMHLHPSYG